MANTILFSQETKAFYSTGVGDISRVVGTDYLNNTRVGRIVTYKIIIPSEVKKINSLKINFEGHGFGFGEGFSGARMNTIFGAVINENLNDEIIVTVIATGFEDEKKIVENPIPRGNLEYSSNFTYASNDDEDDSDDIIPSFLRKRSGF